MTHRSSPSPVVVGIGEVLWDIFPTRKMFGGAPANFAVHVAQLTGQAYMIGSVGNDKLGQRAIETLKSKSVKTNHVQRCDSPTGAVDVTTSADGHPSYEIRSSVAWDNIVWNQELNQLADTCDAVCFGTLAQRSEPSRTTISRFLQKTDADCLRVYDVNLRQAFYDPSTIVSSLEIANVLKVNEEELPVVLSATGIEQLDGNENVEALAQKFNLKLVILTRGASGSVLYSKGNFSDFNPCEKIEVQDTVGAGDAFLAVAVLGFLNGWPLDYINPFANSVAAYVCTQAGATPQFPDKLLKSIPTNLHR